MWWDNKNAKEMASVQCVDARLQHQHEGKGEENTAKAQKPKTRRLKPYTNQRAITVSERRLACLRVFWKPPANMHDNATEKLFMKDAWEILDKAIRDTSIAKASVHPTMMTWLNRCM